MGNVFLFFSKVVLFPSFFYFFISLFKDMEVHWEYKSEATSLRKGIRMKYMKARF